MLFSDRLYSKYFILRQKKEYMRNLQQNSFPFRPKINKNIR